MSDEWTAHNHADHTKRIRRAGVIDYKRLADKYIARDGGPPKPAPQPPVGPKQRRPRGGKVTITEADYRRLLEAAECDDAIRWCFSCGAWLDHDDPAFTRGGDEEGCVYAMTWDESDKHLCRRDRALKKE